MPAVDLQHHLDVAAASHGHDAEARLTEMRALNDARDHRTHYDEVASRGPIPS